MKLRSRHIPEMILYWLEHAAGSLSVCVPNQNFMDAQVLQRYNDTNYNVDLNLHSHTAAGHFLLFKNIMESVLQSVPIELV